MEKWMIILLVAVVIIAAVVIYTVVERESFKTPSGKLTECEPCTEGCSCDQAPDVQGSGP